MIVADLFKYTEIEKIEGNEGCTFHKVVFDSRKVSENDLFVAVRGFSVDGHSYIAKAIALGASVIVCEEKPEQLYENITFVMVKDSAKALGEIASGYYGKPSHQMKVVGVTGTNGKTTIATLLYQLFQGLGYQCGLFGTVANYVGTRKINATHTTPDPVSLNEQMKEMVDAGCEYCFMEISSHAIHQKRIAGLKLQGAIFTNLTHDHLDYHKTFAAYIAAKKALFDGLPKEAFALVNVDDKNGMVMVQNCKANIKTYSVRAMADFKGRVIESMIEGMHLQINHKELWTTLVGKFNAQNLLAVYGAAISLQQDEDEVLVALSKLNTVDGRFQTIRSQNGITAIVDYAHTPDALQNVIETINQIRQDDQALITVVGAGGDRDKTKRPEMAGVAIKGSDKVVFTSDNPRSEEPQQIIDDMMEGVVKGDLLRTISIVDRKEAIKTACMLAKPGDIILIAGKGHEDYQEIKGVKHPFDDRKVINEIFDLL